jgi:1-acyl-sn-glycerol-3-phosphate acyltransferase
VRLILALLWTAIVGTIPLLVLVASFGNRRAVNFVGPVAMRVWSSGLCRILGIHVTRHGEPPARHVAAFVTPNHLGYVDMLVLASIYGGHFVSRADVSSWPVIGPLARAVGTLFIRREVRRDVRSVGDEIGHHLGKRRRVTAFLEGRSGRGNAVLPFRTSLLEAAVDGGMSCVPVAVGYSLPRNPELDPGDVVAWTGDQEFGRHAWQLLHVRRIDAEVRFLPARRDTDRKRLGRLLEDDVRAALCGGVRAAAPLQLVG